jgi:hypothetical protein
MTYSNRKKTRWASVRFESNTLVVLDHLHATSRDFQSLPPLNARPPKWKLMIDAKMI